MVEKFIFYKNSSYKGNKRKTFESLIEGQAKDVFNMLLVRIVFFFCIFFNPI